MHTPAMRYLREIAEASENRMMLWTRVVQAFGCRHLCEIGVLRGAFAKAILSGAPLVETYYMVDPWRYLEGWNKPANRSDAEFEGIYHIAMEETRAFADKVVVLRDVSKQAMKQI